jgi:hypothetical protein
MLPPTLRIDTFRRQDIDAALTHNEEETKRLRRERLRLKDEMACLQTQRAMQRGQYADWLKR